MDSKKQDPAMDPKNQDPAMDSKKQDPANGELKDGELNAVTGGLGGKLAAAVVQGVVTGMTDQAHPPTWGGPTRRVTP
jgi:hypothetical protein